MVGRALSKGLRNKLWKGTSWEKDTKRFKGFIYPSEYQSALLRSGECMAHPTPCLDQVNPTNSMTGPGGYRSRKFPRGQWQLWRTYKSLELKLVDLCIWQQSHKLNTKLPCMTGWQKRSLLSVLCEKNTWKMPCGKRFYGQMRPRLNYESAMKTCGPLLDSWRWAGGSPSSTTTTLNTPPKKTM